MDSCIHIIVSCHYLEYIQDYMKQYGVLTGSTFLRGSMKTSESPATIIKISVHI